MLIEKFGNIIYNDLFFYDKVKIWAFAEAL